MPRHMQPNLLEVFLHEHSTFILPLPSPVGVNRLNLQHLNHEPSHIIARTFNPINGLIQVGHRNFLLRELALDRKIKLGKSLPAEFSESK